MLYSLFLLRGFELRVDAAAFALPGSAQRLAAFLALQERPLARSCVAGRLWPDASEENAHASLRSALWRSRRSGSAFIESRDGRLGIHRAVAVDTQALVARARRLIDRSAACDEEDLGDRLPDDDLLPGWNDEWVLVERERLRHLRLHALEALAERLAALGRFADAVEAGLEAVRSEPLRESAHRVLIKVHLAEGNHGEARRQHAMCRRLLETELGVTPSAKLNGLLAEAATGP